MQQQHFLQQLKEQARYLYDIEMEVQRVKASTGYGEVSVVLRVAKGEVNRSEMLGSSTNIYKHD